MRILLIIGGNVSQIGSWDHVKGHTILFFIKYK